MSDPVDDEFVVEVSDETLARLQDIAGLLNCSLAAALEEAIREFRV